MTLLQPEDVRDGIRFDTPFSSGNVFKLFKDKYLFAFYTTAHDNIRNTAKPCEPLFYPNKHLLSEYCNFLVDTERETGKEFSYIFYVWPARTRYLGAPDSEMHRLDLAAKIYWRKITPAKSPDLLDPILFLMATADGKR